MTRNGILRLNESARAVLKGEKFIEMALPRLSVSSAKKNKYVPTNIDKQLFAKLKQLRKQIADENNLPAFVIFSDASLADMTTKLPTSSEDFMRINGVGETKLERYGSAFINLIGDYLAAKA